MVKGKRWKKGESSSSNPTFKKYRDSAKSSRMFFSFGLPTENKSSGLTAKALAQLDAQSMGKTDPINFDAKSVISDAESADTFRSWASNWSDCTNATFNKVYKYWNSNSALHKEILAVLAAITEVIKENNGQETETEYLAALMTGLDSVKENEESTAAFLYLIALAIKKVPENVLKAKYEELLEQLMEPIRKYGQEANSPILIKSGLMCLCWLLKSQSSVVWGNDKTLACYHAMLNFVCHSKPKVRKCGQEAVRLVIKSFSSTSETADTAAYDRITSITVSQCLKKISGNDAAGNDEQTGSATHKDNILYILNLFKHITHHFQLKDLKQVGECLLRLITLKDPVLTSTCFQIFYHLFNAKTNRLTAELNAQMLNAFYDYKPSDNDPEQMIAWLAVVESSVKSLNRLNKQLCLTHLPVVFQSFMQVLSSSHQTPIHVVITNCLCSMLEQCVETNIQMLAEDIGQSLQSNKKPILTRVFSHVENGLGFQFHSVWIYVMKILACAFTSFKHAQTFSIVEKCLSSLANLRESEQFEYKKEADLAIGRAIQNYGPRLVLESIPLGITGDETSYEYPRSWMLPLLKDFVEKTDLSYFVNYLMPLANKLRARSEQFAKNRQMIEYKIFNTLQNQIWSTLPGFCNFPTDFSTSFKHVAKTLGETLEKCGDLRYSIMQALRLLINRNEEENVVMMSKYAKNYLPILFNLYISDISIDKDPNRQSVLDTIKCYLKVADAQLANTYLQQAIKNYENYSKSYEESLKNKKTDENNNSGNKVVFDFDKKSKDKKTVASQVAEPSLFSKYSSLDLIAVLAEYANDSSIATVYELAINGIENKNMDKTVQKKSYKILDSILARGKTSAGNESIHKFIQSHFESIADKFVQSLSKCNSAAKFPRLKCLLDLLDYVNSPSQKLFLRRILPEVIMCIREVNHKSRDVAFQLLNSILKVWQRLGLSSSPALNEIESLNEFVHLVMVGLAGSTNMVSCSCLALASLTHEFRENISGSLINELIDTSCLLVRSNNKEIVLASLNLLKVLCSIFQQGTLGQFLDRICDAIHNLHEKRSSPSVEATTPESLAANSFNNAPPVTKSQRIKAFVKLILKKLMRKFSYEILHAKLFAAENKPGSGSMMAVDSEPNKVSLSATMRQGLEHLLTNLKKMIDKEKQKRLEDQANTKKENRKENFDLISIYTKNSYKAAAKHNEVEELLEDSESEEEDTKSKKSEKLNKKKKSSSSELTWLQEAENEDPLDLLDPMAIKHVLATKPLTKEQIEKKKEKKMANRGFKTNNDGRLVIEDSDEDSDMDVKSKKSFKSVKSKQRKDDEIDDMMDTLSISKKSTRSAAKKNKRSFEEDSDEESDMEDVKSKKSNFKYKAGGSGIHRKIDPEKKTLDVGSEYRAKKAKGDMKLKNKPDPYAYIPFNFTKLNKRKKAKLQGEFKGVVKAGRGGRGGPSNK